MMTLDKNRTETSNYYVHVFNQGQKHRMEIDPQKGLGQYITHQRILEKRIRVQSSQEFQELLNEGLHFSILKFDPHHFRWKKMISFNQKNAYVQQNNLIINGNSKPIKLAGLLETDLQNLDILTIESQPSEKNDIIPITRIIHYNQGIKHTSSHNDNTKEIQKQQGKHYFVHIFNKGRKEKLYINLERGLGNFLIYNKILERRVFVHSPEEAQRLINTGEQFAILKFDPLQFRWKSLILFHQNNSYINNHNLIINDTIKPLHQSGLINYSEEDLNLITILHDKNRTRESLFLSQTYNVS